MNPNIIKHIVLAKRADDAYKRYRATHRYSVSVQSSTTKTLKQAWCDLDNERDADEKRLVNQLAFEWKNEAELPQDVFGLGRELVFKVIKRIIQNRYVEVFGISSGYVATIRSIRSGFDTWTSGPVCGIAFSLGTTYDDQQRRQMKFDQYADSTVKLGAFLERVENLVEEVTERLHGNQAYVHHRDNVKAAVEEFRADMGWDEASMVENHMVGYGYGTNRRYKSALTTDLVDGRLTAKGSVAVRVKTIEELEKLIRFTQDLEIERMKNEQ